MKKSVLLFSLLSGTAIMLPNLAIASNINTHTNTPKPELSFEFAKLDNAYKVAGVCFLGVGDCGDASYGSIDGDDDYTIDTIKQCKNEGYVNSCASGYCLDHSCPYNASYGTCLVDNCPSNSSTSCTGSVVSQNNCGENCKKCCDDTCKTGSKDYTGSVVGRTECGSTCYSCNTSCPSGSSTSYTGTSAGTNECGQTCKKCNNACPAGYSTSTTAECYDTTTNECGTTCYKEKDCDPCAGYYECGGTWQYCGGSTCPADSSRCSTYCESDHFPYSCGNDYGPCYGDYRSGYCSVPCDKIETDPCDGVTGLSCSNGCASYGSCGQCTSCNSTPPSDPCEGVTGVSCSYGCASYGSCGECTSCNQEPDEPDDPCEGVTCPTAVSCGSRGCASYSSSTSCCSSVCTSCNADPCDNREETAIPANGYCEYYWFDCPSKCYNWNCNPGYSRRGNSCVKDLSCSDGGYYSYKPTGYECSTVGWQGLICYSCRGY